MKASKTAPKPPSTRQRAQQIHVPVLPAEAIEIKKNAAMCGMPVATYLRKLGLNYKPTSLVDAETVPVLIKVNADLGRLGGLLKMFLTNDEKLKILGKEQTKAWLEKLLADIETTQLQLYETVKRL